MLVPYGGQGCEGYSCGVGARGEPAEEDTSRHSAATAWLELGVHIKAVSDSARA
jgi:hypothetical protein